MHRMLLDDLCRQVLTRARERRIVDKRSYGEKQRTDLSKGRCVVVVRGKTRTDARLMRKGRWSARAWSHDRQRRGRS